MSRTISLRLLALSLVVPLALLALPHGAFADAPIVENIDFSDTFPICGVDTTFEVVGTNTFHIQQLLFDQGNGNIHFEGIAKLKATVYYTSNVNGHTLTNTINNTTNDISYQQLSASVYSFTYSINGIAVWLRDGNKTLLKDRGRIVLTDTVDFHDLNNPDDDEFLGEDLVSVAGPHPAYASDAFCNAYVPVMTS